MNKLLFASVISEIQQSDIFMTVKARICEAPAANLNGARVTEAFISEIVDNKEQYVGLPLYADVRALVNGNYRRLGHLYDSKTGEFHSTQIGSFYDFEKEELEEGCALIGYARIAKRNKKLSNALLDLFGDGALKFSFEITVGEYEELDDGTILIDASDSNYLEGTAIVTFPACEDAVALELVAQHEAEQSAEADDIEGGEKEMADNKVIATEQVDEKPVVAEESKVEEKTEVQAEAETTTEVQAEANAEETAETKEDKEDAEKETAQAASEPENAEQQNAAVVVHENHYESNSVSAYDTESGVEVYQNVSVDTSVRHVEPDAQIVEADDGVHIAEDGGEGGEGGNTGTETNTETGGETNGGEQPAGEQTSGSEGGNAGNDQTDPGAADEQTEEEVLNTPESKKKTAEQLIAELAEVVEGLKKEIAELKEQKQVAETQTVTAEINPFIDSIQSTGTYTLLQKDDDWGSDYTLLGKA